MLVIACAADKIDQGLYPNLRHTAARKGIYFVSRELKPFSWARMIEWEYEVAMQFEHDIVCFVDAWDFILQGSAMDIVGALGTAPMVFHSEATCDWEADEWASIVEAVGLDKEYVPPGEMVRDENRIDWAKPVFLSEKDMDECRQLAVKRREAKVSARVGTRRFYKDPYEEDSIGLYGELAFEKKTGHEMDRTIASSGDSGNDFLIDALVIDIKTFRKAYNMVIKPADVVNSVADVVVLARFTLPNRVDFIGWETMAVMKTCPTHRAGERVPDTAGDRL